MAQLKKDEEAKKKEQENAQKDIAALEKWFSDNAKAGTPKKKGDSDFDTKTGELEKAKKAKSDAEKAEKEKKDEQKKKL